MREKTEGQRAPIRNEASNGLSNKRGTICMARTNDPDTATSQFFINLVDNARTLDPRPGSAGYAVFGKVIAGMDTVDAIAKVPTGRKGLARRRPPETDHDQVGEAKAQVLSRVPAERRSRRPP